MKQITRWYPSHRKLHTEYGFIEYGDWCRLEAKRIGEHALVRDDTREVGQVAVFIRKPGEAMVN